MPEGDTIFRAARTLNRALAGKLVTRFESVFPHLARVDTDRPLAGRTIESAIARGKHILMTFSGDLILHTHMRMSGSWHLYRPHERWQRSRADMRVLIETEAFVAVGFSVPVAEFLSSRELARHRDLQALGPDLLDEDFDPDLIATRVRAHGAATIADVLLNQRVAAGIGNVLKSETLFVAGVNPATVVALLTDAALERVLVVARKLLAVNVLDRPQALGPSRGRRTTGSLNPGAALWVYGRAGQPCRRCGTSIQLARSGADARSTYWCPRCQPPVTSKTPLPPG